MNKLDKESIVGIAALLVHAANIDEIYTNHEKDLIKNFIKSYLDKEDANKVLTEAEKIESNSNQLLNFTNIIKKILWKLKKILLNIYGKLLFLIILLINMSQIL
jgi:uncharacterized tellurite resistance protein B-like protein